MLANRYKDKKIVDQVFKTNKMAIEAAKKFGADNVVNSTIGTLRSENGELVVLKTVEEVFSSLKEDEIMNYASDFSGTAEFKEASKINILGRDYKENLEGFYFSAISTSGGSGAISNSIKNYLNPGDTVLLPNWMWGPYRNMVFEHGGTSETYKIFNDKMEFNIEDFKDKLMSLAQVQDNVIVIINDPAQNPTGYRLSLEEWKNVLDEVEIASKSANIILINDVAYIDYDMTTKEEKKEFLELIKNISENTLFIFANSFSKSFTMYGLRVGSQVAISKDKNVIEEFDNANAFTCRTTVSSISAPGMKVVSTIILDEELRKKIEIERSTWAKLMSERANIFLTEAKEVGLEVLPYRSGFFVTIVIGDKIAEIKKELEENHIYTVQFGTGIRIALCSTPMLKLYDLAGRIKSIIDKHN